MGIKVPSPWKTLIIKFPPPRDGKGVKCPGIPRAFDIFAVPGRREFDDQSLSGGEDFDPHALGVGNLNCTLDFM